jgi:hypothetical protein
MKCSRWQLATFASLMTVWATTTQGTTTLLHEFAGGAADGNGVYAVVILAGSTLYGATYTGGVYQ